MSPAISIPAILPIPKCSLVEHSKNCERQLASSDNNSQKSKHLHRVRLFQACQQCNLCLPAAAAAYQAYLISLLKRQVHGTVKSE